MKRGRAGHRGSKTKCVQFELLEARLLLSVASGLIEPNDTISNPVCTNVGPNGTASFVETGLSIGDNGNVAAALDVDLFEINLNANDRVIIDIDATEFGSSLDAIAIVFDLSGSNLAKNDDEMGAPHNDPLLDFIAPATGMYYVGISGWENDLYDPFTEGSGSAADTGTYDIAITYLGQEPIDPDAFEPNDDSSNPTVLAPGDHILENLNIHENGNDDWYRFTPVVSGDATVDLLFFHAQGDLDLEVYDSGLSLLADSDSGSNNERVKIPVVAGQNYLVKVTGFNGSVSGDYELIVAARDQTAGEIRGTVINEATGNGLSGWNVFVDQDGDGQRDGGEPFDTTDQDGNYAISVSPGVHVIALELMPGWEEVPGGGEGDLLSLATLTDAPVTLSINLEQFSEAQLASATRWVIGFDDGADVLALGEAMTPVDVIDNTFVWESAGAGALATLESLEGVAFFYPLIERQLSTRVPNDPQFGDQRHLQNTGQSGGTAAQDANVVPVWDGGITGDGVVIGIVDDGLQHSHPDLTNNYVANLSFDFNNNDADPTPDDAIDDHGTSVAGVAGAQGDNSIGVSGAAPDASLAGLRLISQPTDDATEADALSHMNQSIDIYNNSWGPDDFGVTLEGPGPLTLAALQQGVMTGRGGLGNITFGPPGTAWNSAIT